jgi:hypothetical protein
MKRLAPVLLIAALVAGPAAQAQSVERSARQDESRRAHSRANPGTVIAAEVAFNQLAQKKGQWTAFLETSALEAEMFTPQRVNAKTWLKGRPNPPQPVKWQPHEVWSSCDGSYAVTRGAWQRPDGKSGYFTTLWQRQPKKGDYKWLLDQGDELAAQIAAPEMIAGLVADCRAAAPRPLSAPAPQKKQKPPAVPISPSNNAAIPGIQPIALALEGDRKDGRSRDGTLDWASVVAPDGARIFAVRIWKDGEMREVLRSVVDAEPEPAKP